MSSRQYDNGRWAGGAGERQARVVYVVGEKGGPAQLIDVDQRHARFMSEAAAFVHTLADRVEALKRGLERYQ